MCMVRDPLRLTQILLIMVYPETVATIMCHSNNNVTTTTKRGLIRNACGLVLAMYIIAD